MKKLMIAMAFVAMTASVAMAQNETKTCDKKDCKAEKTEQCCKQDGKKCDKPCDQQRACPFEGLNLTDTQKEQLKALQQERAAQRQATQKDRQAQKAAKKEARQADRKAYLEKVKAILTPEQYVQYLENAATRADKGIKRDMKKMEGRFDRSKGRQLGDRAPRQAQKAAKLQPAQKVEK